MLFESIVNWAVPVFVMISEAVTLSHKCDCRSISKKAYRIVALFVVWSLAFLLFDFAVYGTGP
jgi:surface polysaccharide O-acyltransferase-like enzyme